MFNVDVCFAMLYRVKEQRFVYVRHTNPLHVLIYANSTLLN